MKWINEMISVIALLPTEAVILCHLYIINFAVLWRDQLHFQFVLVVQLAVIKDTVNVVCEKAYPFLAKWCGQYVKSGALLTGG